ncbi:uncharacterized protein LOC130727418 [Lotus japonicus]|uniref:uncharacterized protein LOC130727418 n=1 Tax=Lotus japonicus TaxID=34305 RepID=UPI00258339D0|nr:uncharacterized protein LOC130727418 [Lotus japonicus]
MCRDKQEQSEKGPSMMMMRHILRCKSFSPSSPLLQQVCEFSSSSPPPQPQPKPQPQSRCDDHFYFFGIHVILEKLSNYGIHLPPNALEKKYDTEEEEDDHIQNEMMKFDTIIKEDSLNYFDCIQYAYPYHYDNNSEKKYVTEDGEEEEDHIRNEKMKFDTIIEDDTLYYEDDTHYEEEEISGGHVCGETEQTP